jgi:hypothetical protein
MSAGDNDEQVQAYDTEEQLVVPQVTLSMLLAMAWPAKSRRHCCSPATMQTDGKAFEIVEVDGHLVAFDETDGRLILLDENAEDSFLYSDIVPSREGVR